MLSGRCKNLRGNTQTKEAVTPYIRVNVSARFRYKNAGHPLLVFGGTSL